jgi:hypothetical protein
MADPLGRAPASSSLSAGAPPPPPPLPPALPPSQKVNRATSALARLAQPFFAGSRPPSPPDGNGPLSDEVLQGARRARSKSL